MPPSNGSIGSTTAACSGPSGTSLRRKRGKLLRGSGNRNHGSVTNSNQPPTNPERFTPAHERWHGWVYVLRIRSFY